MRTFLLSALLTVMVSLAALAEPPRVVVVQYHVTFNQITITRGVGQTRTKQLGPLNARNKFQDNAEELQSIFNTLYLDGYELRSSSEVGSVAAGTQTVTYVFVMRNRSS
jgi:hypothetical protein